MEMRTGPLDDRQSWKLHGFTDDPSSLTAAGSLPNTWVRNWTEHPDDEVLVSSSRPVDRLTGADMLRETRLVAGVFHRLGVRRGDRILMSAPPSIGLVVAHVAALRLGAIVVPVNTAYTTSEVEAVAAQARPSVAVLDDPSRLPGIPCLDPEGLRTTGHDDERSPELDTVTADDPALLMFTSGTTGKPKGVVLTHGNILASAEALRVSWRWTRDDRLVLALPLFHMHGLGVGIHGTLLAGASAVIVPKFDVDTIFDAIRDHAATLFFGVPTMWVRIAESPRVAELSALRLCVSGSAPMSPDVFRSLEERGEVR